MAYAPSSTLDALCVIFYSKQQVRSPIWDPHFGCRALAPPFWQAARNTLLSVNFVIFLLAALVIKFKLATGLRERLGVGPTPGGSSSDNLSSSDGEDAVLNGGALPKSSPFAPRHRSIQVCALVQVNCVQQGISVMSSYCSGYDSTHMPFLSAE